MDREMATAMRSIRSTGRTTEMILELIHDMREEQREIIWRNLRFLNERERVTWHLGNREDNREIAIRFLGDGTIHRLLNSKPAMNRWRAFLKYGDNWQLNLETFSSSPNPKRSRYDVIIEEAEHRGILNNAQITWQKVRDSPLDLTPLILNNEFSFPQECNTRGGHVFTLVDTQHVCINCRLKVNCEEISKRASSMLRGRLREFAC